MSFWLTYYLAGNLGAAVFLAILLGATLRRQHKTLTEWALAGMALSALGWNLGDALSSLFLHISEPGAAALLKSVAGSSAVLLAVTGYFFSQALVNGTARIGPQNTLILTLGALAVILPFLPGWMEDLHVTAGFDRATLGPLYWLTNAYNSLTAGLAVFCLARGYRSAQGRQRLHIRVIFIVGLLAITIITIAQSVLPWLGIFAFFPIGHNAGLLLFFGVAYLVVFHRFLDLRSFALRQLLYAAVIMPPVLLIFWLLRPAFDLPAFLLLSLVTAGAILLFLYFRLAVDRVHHWLFPGRRLQEQDLRDLTTAIQILQDARPSMDVLLEQILHSLSRLLQCDRAYIYCGGQRAGTSIHKALGPPPHFNLKRHFRFFFRRLRLPPEIAGYLGQVFLFEPGAVPPLPDLLQAKRKRRLFLHRLNQLVEAARQDGYPIALPFLVQGELCGCLFMGQKNADLPWYSGDLRLLENARIPITLALWNASLYEDLHRKAEQEARRQPAIYSGPIAPTEQTVFDRLLVYGDPRMARVVDRARHVARLDVPVIITGETGTGKELIARLIHQEGGKPLNNFVAVNCGAIPESLFESELFGSMKGAFTDAKEDRPGLIEQAGNGTLFLDEIGELPLPMQTKLLRLAQEKQFQRVGERKLRTAQCRLISATHRDLAAMVKAGQMREDLYYRLQIFEIALPPLRERRTDIPVLVQHLIHGYATEFKTPVRYIEQDALDALCRYEWPGNVRDLQNCILRICTAVETDTIRLADLPHTIKDTRKEKVALNGRNKSTSFRGDIEIHGLDALLNEFSRDIVTYAIKRSQGNLTQAAQILKITRPKLYRLMESLGIER
ncbi:MAG: sigma 54-interacting transcriptional regulator [Spirochaetales bacterium]|nr:sigma 54-interacting transcriptional regulator [Spirochaetales bacterium]